MVHSAHAQVLQFGDDTGELPDAGYGGQFVFRRTLIVTSAIILGSIGLATPAAVSSAPASDAKAQREQVRAEKARVAAQIDTSKASLGEIDAALSAIDANLRTQEAGLARAEADVAQAEKDITDAEAAIARLTGEVSRLRREMQRRAVESFVNPPTDDLLTVLDTNDFTAASSRKFFIELRALDDADIADRLSGATSDLQYQRRKAKAAKVRAEAKRTEQAQRMKAVQSARDAQQRIATNIQATIDSQVNRSLELAKTDRALSAQIAEEQAQLLARLAAQQAAQRAAAAAEAAQQNNGGGSGGTTAPPPPIGTGTGAGTGTGGISLCSVGGITVNCAIKTQVANLLNAARADGLVLSGGGYRDPASQIALRQAHCGSTYYAIYLMPSSQCSPPTAPPGTSQHELGLAIDFYNCNYRSTACYQWLAGNASRFGFYNLPSEPWHWSTTGR